MSRGRPEAVIWDMDGVIADTIEYHYQAWKEEFAKKGVYYSMEEFLHHFGQRNDTIIKDTLGAGISPEELAAINNAKQANFRRRVAGNVLPLPGVVALIKSLHKHDIKQAIASSAPPENITVVLRALGVERCFQATVYGDEVAEGKPSPLIYLTAAQKLGAMPAGCIVIEDAIAGVEGARRAGMKCVAVTNSHPADKLKQADLVVSTLETVNIDVLTCLFRKTSVKK